MMPIICQKNLNKNLWLSSKDVDYTNTLGDKDFIEMEKYFAA